MWRRGRLPRGAAAATNEVARVDVPAIGLLTDPWGVTSGVAKRARTVRGHQRRSAGSRPRRCTPGWRSVDIGSRRTKMVAMKPPGSRTKAALGCAVLLIAYFVTARLGLYLGAVAGLATLVWPPSGIAP